MQHTATSASSGENTGGGNALSGMKVVVSGAMSGSLAGIARNAMNELIEANGGKSSGSVSSSTQLLVTGDMTSSKTVKARELGVTVMTPEEFAALIGR
jgi:DNA ligase (NAD+)